MRDTQYYWVGDDGVLFHTKCNSDRVDPFFDSIEQAERFLENRADVQGKDQFRNLTLRSTDHDKQKEATAVLTSQTGIGDFGGGATGD